MQIWKQSETFHKVCFVVPEVLFLSRLEKNGKESSSIYVFFQLPVHFEYNRATFVQSVKVVIGRLFLKISSLD